MTLHPDLIQSALAQVPGFTRVVIGFSGGLDSTVLLHLVKQWQQQHPEIPLLAIHANHQLQPLAATWAHHCQQTCQAWGIPLLAEAVQVEKAQASLEQAARNARYHLFQQQVGPADVLLLAHHRDDQVETLLQRLLRGSGPLGLGGMGSVSQQQGLTTVRPLLELDRLSLESYAHSNQLTWVDDPTNHDSSIDRNFLRNEVLPLLRSRWPQLNQTLARSARLNRDAAELLDDLARLDSVAPFLPGQPLPVAGLQALRESRALNLLRSWIRAHQAQLPSEAQLQRVLREMLTAPDDGQPELTWGPYQIRRYQGALYCLPKLPLPSRDAVALDLAAREQPWQGGVLTQNDGRGIALSRSRLAQASLTVTVRQGGERLKPMGRRSNSLKHWLQDYRVPPWWRDYWPILLCDDNIAALPGVLVCEGFQPVDTSDTLWLDWQPPTIGFTPR